MKLLRVTALTILSILPSLTTALTVEELLASLSDDQVENFQNIDPTQYELITDLLTPVLVLENEEDRFFIVDEVLWLFTNYSVQTMNNAFDEFEYAGIPLTVEQKIEIENFVAEENLNLARQILETRASIEEINAETARLREFNLTKQKELDALRDEAAALRDEAAALRDEAAAARARIAQIEQRIARIQRVIDQTREVIADLEAL